MQSFKLSSHGKINLFLKVLSKREDGYHEIFSLISKIGLKDTILVKRREDSRIVFRSPLAVDLENDQNLILKAINRYEKRFGLKLGAEITLIKRIPIAAGLAGGSSNAASILLNLDQIVGRKISTKNDLIDIAAALGSDIPFFIKDCNAAFVESRGEIVKPVRLENRLKLLIINPKEGVLTKDSYQNSNFNFEEKLDRSKLISAFSGKFSEITYELMKNDLEEYAIGKIPLLGKIIKTLYSCKEKPLKVMISGSGPTLFAIFEKNETLSIAKKALTAYNIVVRSSCTL